MIRRFLFLLAAWPGCVLAGCTLAGCTLIDQNTFNPTAGAVPVIPPAPVAAAVPAPSGPPPLFTVHPGQPSQEAVRQAVAAARNRKADVAFDVVAVVPGDEQAAASSSDAAAVARSIAAQGVPTSRVHLFARPEAGLAGREVRVYVR